MVGAGVTIDTGISAHVRVEDRDVGACERAQLATYRWGEYAVMARSVKPHVFDILFLAGVRP